MRYESVLRRVSEKSGTYQKMAALLEKGGSPVSTGHPVKTTHPMVTALAAIVGEPKFSVHAELDALLHLPLDMIAGSTMYVARFRRDGSLALAKPCKVCTAAMYICGVKKVIFSTGPGSFSVIGIDDLVNDRGLTMTFTGVSKSAKFGSNLFIHRIFAEAV